VASAVILHIPHALSSLPPEERNSLALSDKELRRELLRLTDWYVDELFDLPDATRLVSPVSRLVVDVERFIDDDAEPMAQKGMGVVYTRTSDDKLLRKHLITPERERLIERYYQPHHMALNRLVKEALHDHGCCLIIDAHSFPSCSLPCDFDQTPDRPDICIGTDDFHTPIWLQGATVQAFTQQGWQVAMNRPYSGSIVPTAFYRTDQRVFSIMVEMNRALYLNEQNGKRLVTFTEVQEKLTMVLKTLVTVFLCGYPQHVLPRVTGG
jgi:N-formylglutamate deformylase